MSVLTCCFEGCFSQRYPGGAITFFQVPLDEPRRTAWILNSGNKALTNLQQHQKRFVCELHFNKKYIKWQGYRKQLHRNAVPISHVGNMTSTNTTSIAIATTTNDSCNENQFEEINGITIDNENRTDNVEQFNTNIQNLENLENVICEESDIKGELNNQTNEHCESCTDDNLTTQEQDMKDVTYIKHQVEESISFLTEEKATTNDSPETELNDIVFGKDVACGPAETPTIADYIACSDDDDSNIADVTEIANQSTTANINALDSSLVKNVDNDETKNTASTFDVNELAASENDMENTNEINECTCSATASSSYESDKHFALSLVYYFQRLDMKKKTRAKIDILTYLMALEQEPIDDDDDNNV